MSYTNKLAIAIDGPAAAGKSTVAKWVAKDLEYVYIDTGAMYRSLTYACLQNQIELTNEQEVLSLLKSINITLTEDQNVYIDQQNVTEAIRTSQVTQSVSAVASIPEVRQEMVKQQKILAAKRGVVMDGRDIGTHVIPDAEVKIFLNASVVERAKRRHQENMDKGFSSDLEQIKKDIERRDQIDSEREVSPLRKADDAIEIDTTSKTIQDVANEILSIVQKYKESEA
ncbi:cytidylate kinase [Gracilibacillus halophilus YIM-C55.5]|uniref:Cytidylate kinase n=1 Tax=Gracilibacillus halophilus YIM-C55.5 TaxID=1308866 RepID=N4WSJ0_9BACI|nr:(d)CMP kinase [Gracilibacillus halophilus]ENH97355.1 cytidylate kinase [Gracilibacillus halophilus YIM-C55.5]